MPRKPRLDMPGLLVHIIARCIDGNNIFRDDADRRFFLDRLGLLLVETATPVYAFALIPNHFHLLLRRNDVPISKIMLRLLSAYAAYFNRRHDRRGHLFQNRYKSIICADDAYFLELVRYIGLNPLRAGVVESLDQLSKYGFCSHGHIMGNHKADWFDGKPVLGAFGGNGDAALKAYSGFLAAGLRGTGAQDLDGGGLRRSMSVITQLPARAELPARADLPEQTDSHDSRILGPGSFVESLCGQVRPEGPRAPQKTFDEILAETCETYGVSADRLLGRTRAKDTLLPRTRFASRLSMEAGMSGSDIARRLSMSRSAVSRMLKRGEKLVGQE